MTERSGRRIKLGRLLLVITVVFIVLQYVEVGTTIDLRLQDQLLQQERPANNDIVIVAIDDESLQYMGSWPWERSVHATLLEQLAEANVAAIGFDITFPLPSTDAIEDEQFVNAVKRAGNVVLAQFGVFDEFSTGDIYAVEMQTPFPALEAAASQVGHLNTIVDMDSVVRKALLQFYNEDQRIDSFAWKLAEQYAAHHGKQLAREQIPLDKFGRFHIPFATKPQTYEVVPYWMVVSGEIDPAYFENRIVLVGTYTPGIKDYYLTPLDSKQSMYGVEIHANIIQTILEGNYKQEVHWLINSGILLVAAIIAYWICRIRSVIASFAVMLVAIIAFLSAARLLYSSGFIMSLVYVVAMLATIYIAMVANNYIVELRERKRVTEVFGKYVAPEVVKQILQSGEEGLKLGGSRRTLTILFVDIRGFTTLSEKVEPEEIVAILNEYLDLTANCIFKFGGTLDKFIGDATMAVFNAPLTQPDHPMQAIRTAWAMKEGALPLERALQQRYGQSVSFGIGIHTGQAVVGNIGSKTRMDYTVIGDTVNTAARLESIALPGQIILSEAVYEQVKDSVKVVALGEVQLKGKDQLLTIYEMEGLK
ncbi:CHASE2 domain-containing protein [Paenibacillus yanchengensis]|uniref:CHASE2 domain-containing protein n=1 Tax=Paenibacillus yanchengensis TaxID=2035833 RepID=A0ABW4YIK1_9BACL